MECPVCFSSEILGRRDKERDHGPCAYCNSFSCLALALAAGAGPGARRAIRRPSTRSSPVTNSAAPTGQRPGDRRNVTAFIRDCG
jgi:hypothetical protein